MSKKLTIDDLLAALENPATADLKDLKNTAKTWQRIGEKNPFSELGLEPSELDAFLKDWVAENPYSNI